MKNTGFSLTKKKHGSRRLNSSQMIVGVFLLIIIAGAILLSLPISSRDGQSCGVLVALFTATSATCVTGLSLVDTYTQWSTFGQVVILLMIETGGLGFMTLASMFFFAVKRKIDFEQMLLMAQTAGTDKVQDTLRVYKKIIIGSVSVELIGALILSLRFHKWYSLPKSVWLGVFHSVSAFCNAGFDVLGFIEPGSSLATLSTDFVICITAALLVIIGGVGFIVWDDITSQKHPKRWSMYTKVVLYTTGFLLLTGTIAIFLLERNNPATLGEMTFSEKMLASFFQSATTRTAGFAALNQGSLTEAGKLVSILLMFIGGASGSTAGGLKVVTFLVVMKFLFARTRGQDEVNILSRRVTQRQITDALSLFGIMILLSLLGSLVICASTDFSFVDAMYETVSAIATVGLTTGITDKLGLLPQILLIVYMFFGRIGILTINMGFFKDKRKADEYKYPDAVILIG